MVVLLSIIFFVSPLSIVPHCKTNLATETEHTTHNPRNVDTSKKNEQSDIKAFSIYDVKHKSRVNH